MFTIILATGNLHKVWEIQGILGLDDKVVMYPYTDFIEMAIPEPGETLLENSLLKAEFIYRIVQLPTLAEDSGLFIEKLNGAPGVLSARYEVDDKRKIERVLRELGDSRNRRAWFRSVLVYYYAPKKYAVFEGEIEGRIAYEPRGKYGFGYDPIFIPKGYRKTLAELGPGVKNLISHRAKAVKKFKKFLLPILAKTPNN
jgi:XTP/dITP diphosphohydrolase|uniref:dITP/XTP pyrophosphatase n=1 Tax=candidate division WOR-3 bacterium TaxID=2052148 RepID=A0A7C4THN6_UNCW3